VILELENKLKSIREDTLNASRQLYRQEVSANLGENNTSKGDESLMIIQAMPTADLEKELLHT